MKPIFILISPLLIVILHEILILLNVKTVCIWQLLTGHKCIGCGMTTAIVYCLQGNFHLAYQSNPNVVIVVPLLLYCWLDYLYKNIKVYKIKKD